MSNVDNNLIVKSRIFEREFILEQFRTAELIVWIVRDADVRRARDGDAKVKTDPGDVGFVLQVEVKASRSIELKPQPRRLSNQRMPILPPWTTFGVDGVSPESRRERYMIADIPRGMAVGHATVRIGGALSWPDDIDTWEGLVAIYYALRSPRLQLVPIGVKNTVGQGLRVE